MKVSVPLLALSLAANLALVVALASRPSFPPPPVRDIFPRSPAPTPVAPPLRSVPSAAPTPLAAEKMWTRLHTEDLRELVARLRAAGFPAPTIAALVEMKLAHRFGPRIRELELPDPDTPFWKLPSAAAFDRDPERLNELVRLQREVRTQFQDLLGGDFFATPERIAAQSRAFGDLPRAKLDLVESILSDYGEIERLARNAMQGVAFTEDKATLALIDREKHADLARTLTTAEQEELERRISPVAIRLRSQLAVFTPTDAEYRAIFRLEQAADPQLHPPLWDYYDDEENQQRIETQKQLDAHIKAALGDQRYADYVRDTNSEYLGLRALALNENLPIASARQTFALRDTVARESNRIFDDASLDNAQKHAALQALAQNTRAQISGTLGPAAGPAYLQVANAWLSLVERGDSVTFEHGKLNVSHVLPALASKTP